MKRSRADGWRSCVWLNCESCDVVTELFVSNNCRTGVQRQALRTQIEAGHDFIGARSKRAVDSEFDRVGERFGPVVGRDRRHMTVTREGVAGGVHELSEDCVVAKGRPALPAIGEIDYLTGLSNEILWRGGEDGWATERIIDADADVLIGVVSGQVISANLDAVQAFGRGLFAGGVIKWFPDDVVRSGFSRGNDLVIDGQFAAVDRVVVGGEPV